MTERASSLVQEAHASIFVSHSHKDLVTVRRVRNALEAVGAQPLLFFLKCLSDDDEVDGLIKREIESRTFFLLCDSANAKASRWVQSELAHVRASQRRFETIDLDGGWRQQLRGIRALVRDATIFLSYARADQARVLPVQKALSDRDYSVWVDYSNLRPGDSLQRGLGRALRAAARRGFLLHFLSRESLQSQWVRHEISYFVRRAGQRRYIPIALAPLPLIGPLPDELGDIQVLDYSSAGIDHLMPRLLESLRRAWLESEDGRSA